MCVRVRVCARAHRARGLDDGPTPTPSRRPHSINGHYNSQIKSHFKMRKPVTASAASAWHPRSAVRRVAAPVIVGAKLRLREQLHTADRCRRRSRRTHHVGAHMAHASALAQRDTRPFETAAIFKRHKINKLTAAINIKSRIRTVMVAAVLRARSRVSLPAFIIAVYADWHNPAALLIISNLCISNALLQRRRQRLSLVRSLSFPDYGEHD